MASAPTLTPPSPAVNSTISRGLMIGSSIFGGGSALYLAVQLLREQPDRAFALLQKWGPGYLLAFFCAWVINRLAEPLVAGAVSAFGRIATAVEAQSQSTGVMATAMQSLADKDDRQVQEMQTLTAFTAQRSEKTYSMMQQFHEDNQNILREYGETLKRIETKVDQQAREKSGT